MYRYGLIGMIERLRDHGCSLVAHSVPITEDIRLCQLSSDQALDAAPKCLSLSRNYVLVPLRKLKVQLPKPYRKPCPPTFVVKALNGT